VQYRAAVDEKAHLEAEIDALGPWCHEIEVVPGISTRAWRERHPDSRVPFLDPRVTPIVKTALRLFPSALKGWSVLDCGCNAGGYSFLAREAGAGRCFGFDARRHWIDQARFVARCRQYEDMTFEVRELDQLEVELFDMTFFAGLLYHLPDPVHGLKMAADATRELIFVDTSARAGLPDGSLVAENENKELLVSGVHGLNWLPTGPDVVRRMLEWVGFAECAVLDYRLEVEPQVDRLAVIAAKTPGFLGSLDLPKPRQSRPRPAATRPASRPVPRPSRPEWSRRSHRR
jgi:SAM-dependent methyltransferase